VGISLKLKVLSLERDGINLATLSLAGFKVDLFEKSWNKSLPLMD